MNRRNFNVLAAALAAFTAIPATAQSTWPNKPITLVVPYAPGGTADALARVLAQHLGTRLKVSVVVLNKAGASGVIGAASVAQAPAAFSKSSKAVSRYCHWPSWVSFTGTALPWAVISLTSCT